MDRDAPLNEPRVACGETFQPSISKKRNTRRLADLTEPAPLLMRLMTFKTTLDHVSNRKVVVREAMEGRADREATPVPMRDGQAERGELDRPNPVRAWRGEDGPRGMSAARPGLTEVSRAS